MYVYVKLSSHVQHNPCFPMYNMIFAQDSFMEMELEGTVHTINVESGLLHVIQDETVSSSYRILPRVDIVWKSAWTCRKSLCLHFTLNGLANFQFANKEEQGAICESCLPNNYTSYQSQFWRCLAGGSLPGMQTSLTLATLNCWCCSFRLSVL